MSVRALTALATIIATTILTLPAVTTAQSLPIRDVKSPRSLSSEKTAQIELSSLTRKIGTVRGQTWACQDTLRIPRTSASVSTWALPTSIPYRRWVAAKWDARRASCVHSLAVRNNALRSGRFDLLSDRDLYAAADAEIKRGGIYSERWGGASQTLTSLCYEAVRRQFSPFGTQEWARFIVNRESGCNPGAVNQTYSSWGQRARGIAQLIPAYHSWVDYARYESDLRYAVGVFVRLSHGGRSVGPWACC